MLPLVLGAAAVLFLAASAGGGAGGSTGPGSGSVVKGAPPVPRLRIGVARPADPLLDAARKARAYVAANPKRAPELAPLAQLAKQKGRADVATVLEAKS